MKLVRLKAEDFLRLRAVDITFPDSGAVVLGGANGAGKSSTIAALAALLGGGKQLPEEPIRRGARKAQLVLETDELTVTRTFTKSGSELEVKAKDGSRFGSPQKMLDKLLGSLTFDPLAWASKAPKDQATELRALVGLDFAKEDADRQRAYDERTDVGREVKRLQGAVDEAPEVPPGTPDAEVSVVELTQRLEAAQKTNAANEEKRRQLKDAGAAYDAAQEQVERLEQQLAAARNDVAAWDTRGRALAAEVGKLTDVDLNPIRAQVAASQAINSAVLARRSRERIEADLEKAMQRSEKLTERIAQIDEVKAAAAAAAKYPIEGLAVTDDGVALKGVPLEQASHAERLRTSVAIAMKQNPELKLALIREGAFLDDAGLKAVVEMVAAAGGQGVIEVVGDRAGVTVMISDGAVAEVRDQGAAEAAS